MFVKEKLKCD